MTLQVQAERFCEAIPAAAFCAEPAVYLCSGCGQGLCEEHAAFCRYCDRSFCSRCAHICAPKSVLPALAA